MRFTWSAEKLAANIAKHAVNFEEVAHFGFDVALIRADVRFDYGEPRLVAIAPIGSRLHVLVFSVERRNVRLISLRKANRKEFARYAREA
jgi:uncharacterized DUF497 family protein